MKKLVAVLLTFFLLAVFVACGGRPDAKDFLADSLAKAKTPTDQELEAGLEMALSALGHSVSEEEKAVYLNFARAILDRTEYEILDVVEDDKNDTATANIKMTTADFNQVLEKSSKLLLEALIAKPETDPGEVLKLQVEKMTEVVSDPATSTKEYTIPVTLRYDAAQKAWVLDQDLMEQTLTEAMSN